MTDHEKQINQFIPIAENMANQTVKEMSLSSYPTNGVDGSSCVHDIFTELFHKAMNELTSQAGLRTVKVH